MKKSLWPLGLMLVASAAAAEPVFYGDGVHDDAAAIEAAGRGEVVASKAPGFKSSGGYLIIFNARILICRPVMFGSDFLLQNVELLLPVAGEPSEIEVKKYVLGRGMINDSLAFGGAACDPTS